MIKILLFGKNGQLGWELQRCLGTLGEVISLDYPEINLAQPGQIREAVQTTRPQVIINAAAYTAVDKAESEPALAQAINATAPGVMADEAAHIGAALIHYSTDYVYDGRLGRPYCETDSPGPISAYGQSKLAGDEAVSAGSAPFLILRTSWVYSNRQGGFVNKVLEWSRQQPVLKIVSDQVANPTWCRSLAEATAQVLAMAGAQPGGWIAERKGVYHLAGWGYASRLEWARAILAADPQAGEQVVKELLPARTADFPTPAARPLFSALDCALFLNTFGLHLPDWPIALRMAMNV